MSKCTESFKTWTEPGNLVGPPSHGRVSYKTLEPRSSPVPPEAGLQDARRRGALHKACRCTLSKKTNDAWLFLHESDSKCTQGVRAHVFSTRVSKFSQTWLPRSYVPTQAARLHLHHPPSPMNPCFRNQHSVNLRFEAKDEEQQRSNQDLFRKITTPTVIESLYVSIES